MPELRQLDFELSGLVELPPTGRAPRARRQVRAVAELPLSLFDTTAPPAPTTAPPRRGLLRDGDLTAESRSLVAALGLRSLAARIDVFWNTRLITTAGLAHHGASRIDLNPRLARFAPDEPRRTLLHELAHLVAHGRAGERSIQPHGSEWRRACAELGIPGEKRCHNLPLARRLVRRKFAYRCLHCGTVVPRVRKLGRESACYPCCREHNNGRYSRRFLLEEISIERARELAPEHAW